MAADDAPRAPAGGVDVSLDDNNVVGELLGAKEGRLGC